METKSIFQSKTIIGSVVALLSIALSSFFGYEIAGADKAQLTEIIIATLGSAGAVTAIYGRVKATKQIAVK